MVEQLILAVEVRNSRLGQTSFQTAVKLLSYICISNLSSCARIFSATSRADFNLDLSLI